MKTKITKRTLAEAAGEVPELLVNMHRRAIEDISRELAYKAARLPDGSICRSAEKFERWALCHPRLHNGGHVKSWAALPIFSAWTQLPGATRNPTGLITKYVAQPAPVRPAKPAKPVKRSAPPRAADPLPAVTRQRAHEIDRIIAVLNSRAKTDLTIDDLKKRFPMSTLPPVYR